MGGEPRPWWQAAVIYQIYPRSFADTNGDGVGDLNGVTEKLPYLSALGVDAIWLSPFYRSPMVDFGYDVSDHTDVDEVFGDLGAFDRLVAVAHDRRLRVIVDYIPNHTSDQHPWFIESRRSRDSAKRDWYFWRDSKSNGEPPNNWLSIWGGEAWESDAATGQLYYHHFAKEQPDLNWTNPEVRRAMFDVARFWLDRGVDGFRIDVADFIAKDPKLRDNPPNPQTATFHKSFGAYDTQLHVHDRRHPAMHDYYRELRELVDSHAPSRDRVLLGEIHCFDLDQWVKHYGQKQDEIHLPFNFGLLNVPWSASAVRSSVEALESALPEGAWPTYVLGNHDEPRLATRVGPDQARVAAMLLLTLRGTPTLYYGDELGMTDVVVPPELSHDPQGRLMPHLSRDPARSPMLWRRSEKAGFCAEDVRPWLPTDPRVPSVAEQEVDRCSMLSLYRALLALRRAEPPLSAGAYRSVDAPDGVFAFERGEPGGERLRVLLNFAGREVESDLVSGPVVLSTYLDNRDSALTTRLRSHEGLILRVA